MEVYFCIFVTKFNQVCAKYALKMHLKVSIGASYTESLMEFSQAPIPQTAFPTFFSNLDLSKIWDNKTFWETIQPFFLKNEKLQTKLLLQMKVKQ